MKLSLNQRLIATALIAVALTAMGVSTPAAAAPAEETITWAVRPGDADGPDGRNRIELELDPGQTVTEYLVVTNLSRVAAEFQITAADGYMTPNGRFNMLPADRESVDAGTWIALAADRVEIAAGESAVVRFTITVPSNATPGDHPAGVAASVLSVMEGDDGTRMGIDSRVGFRVMTRVTGDVVPAMDLGSVSAQYEMSWDLFQPGRVTLSYAANNTGNIRLETSTTLEASGIAYVAPAVEGESMELFPGDERIVTAEVVDVWPLGLLTVRIDMTGRAVPEDPGVEQVVVSEEVLVWAVPWAHLLVLAGLALIILAFTWGRKRQTARVAELVSEAEAAGARRAREEAAAGADR